MSLTLAQRLAVTEFLKRHFEGTRKYDLNPEAQRELVVGERLAAKFAGRVAAWISVPTPPTKVTNPDRLVDWCRKHLPEEVEEVTSYRVRPETQHALIELVKQHGGWPDEAGEIIPVDGIDTADPSPRVEFTDDADEVLSAAWATGVIEPSVVLALGPAAGGDGSD